MKKKVKRKSKRIPLPPRLTLAQTADAYGVDKKTLMMAHRLAFPGFTAANKINWEILGPELEKRKVELEEALKKAGPELSEKARALDLRIKELKIQKLEGKMLAPEDMKRLMVELATENSAVIKKELDELLIRSIGLAEPMARIEFDKTKAAIFKSLKSGGAKVASLEVE